MVGVTLRGVSKSFGQTKVLHEIDAEIPAGAFAVLVGPSGCGKSTLLRLIAGLEEVSTGSIRFGERDVTNLAPRDRDIAMVFQSYALYPHMTVYQNMAFGLENMRTPKSQIETKVQAAAKLLHLDALLDRRPTELSGGQRQRVAIGRAIVREPKIFLFDEPLSNLDAELRVQMRTEITALHKRLKTTMIYVTHDQVEAMTMADKIVVLRGGRVEQIGAPLALYNEPRNKFVAGFIGSPQMNFLSVRVAGVGADGVRIAADPGSTHASTPVPVRGDAGDIGRQVTLGVRPEHMLLRRSSPGELELTATVELVEQLGATSFLYCMLPTGEKLTVQAAGQIDNHPGEDIVVSFPAARVHLFAQTENAAAFERLRPSTTDRAA